MKYYSPSRLSTYHACPQHYKLKYVERVEMEKEATIPTFIGTALHTSLESHFTEKETNQSLHEISLEMIEKAVGDMGAPPGIMKAAKKYAQASQALYERAQPGYSGPDPIRTKEGRASTSPTSTTAWKEASVQAGLDVYKEAIDGKTLEGIADACAEVYSLCVNYRRPFEIGRVLGVEVPISKKITVEVDGDEVEGFEKTEEERVYERIINPVRIPNTESYLHGYIDMVCESPEGELGVIDYKSGVQGYKKEDLQWNPQLMLYSWAVEEIYGRECKWVGIHNLRGEMVSKRINREKREIVLEALWETISLVDRGIFPKRLMDSPHSCCKKWYGKPCPYMNRCWPEEEEEENSLIEGNKL